MWQPPTTIEYDNLIGEVYAKKPKAIMKFTDGNRAKTAEFLNWDIETVLNESYILGAGRMMTHFDDAVMRAAQHSSVISRKSWVMIRESLMMKVMQELLLSLYPAQTMILTLSVTIRMRLCGEAIL